MCVCQNHGTQSVKAEKETPMAPCVTACGQTVAREKKVEDIMKGRCSYDDAGITSKCENNCI